LLEVVLTRTPGVAPWKWALMIPLSRVNTGVSRQMATCGERLGTQVTHVLFLVHI